MLENKAHIVKNDLSPVARCFEEQYISSGHSLQSILINK